MNETKKRKRWPITILIVSAALIIPGVLLSRLAVDVSLRNWYEDTAGYRLALEEQARTGKPIALFFHTDWCESCKKLTKDVLISEPFKQFLPNVIPVKINPEMGNSEHSVAEQFAVLGYPTFLLVSTNPRRILQIPRTSNIKPEEFVQECRSALRL
jgi:thioredoxin-related protein